MKMYRQGDVLVRRIRKPNLEMADRMSRNEGRVVLAYGEATGHAHAITDPGAILYQSGDRTILELGEVSTLEHEEHESIELPAGYYAVVRQREYDDQADQEEWRHVED